jgi:hypothetical protein
MALAPSPAWSWSRATRQTYGGAPPFRSTRGLYSTGGFGDVAALSEGCHRFAGATKGLSINRCSYAPSLKPTQTSREVPGSRASS